MAGFAEIFVDMILVCSRGGAVQTRAMAKQLHFNKNMEALKKLQAGVDKLSSVVGVTLGPKVHKLSAAKPLSPRHCNDGHSSGWGVRKCSCP